MRHKLFLIVFLGLLAFILFGCGGGKPGPRNPFPEPEPTNQDEDIVDIGPERGSKSPISFDDHNDTDGDSWEAQLDNGYILSPESVLDIELELTGNTRLCFSVYDKNDVDDCDDIHNVENGIFNAVVTINFIAYSYDKDFVIDIPEDATVHINVYSQKKLLLKTQFGF